MTTLVLPDPDIPPGCQNLCKDLGGDFQNCTKSCPSTKECQVAMEMKSPVNEEYTEDVPGLPNLPRLCERHCWDSGEPYTQEQCMKDCPLTWCRKYGKVPKPKSSGETKPMLIPRGLLSALISFATGMIYGR